MRGSPDAIGIAQDGKVGILRVAAGIEPPSPADPALWIAKGAPPIELAPWSKLELATSAACRRDLTGVRALLQTPYGWVGDVGEGGFFRPPGITALVRWSRERICLESIEAGFRGVPAPKDSGDHTADVMLVARFIGDDAGAAFVGLSETSEYHQPVTCRLVPP